MASNRRPDYTYLATRQMGNKTAIVTKVIKGSAKADKNDMRMEGINMMLKRLYNNTPIKQLAAEADMGESAVRDRLTIAKEIGVPEVAREIFIKEFLPASMAVLQEALVGEDLKLAVQVALKVVAGLEVMDDPKKSEIKQMEPESLEVWRAKFTKKPVVEVKAISARRIDETLDITADNVDDDERESAEPGSTLED